VAANADTDGKALVEFEAAELVKRLNIMPFGLL